ncbi:DUF3021 domain-containing protein [Exiguobacterium sp. SH3S2]|uniref:DUF3021 family protein n=1 Tax=unclassified Exiguobacterium TaxID=2644629 RepID=UPI00103BF49B|nr:MULTISPECIES: DUF3021 family protein [unclassified Exiguobacterium]TCI49003.1 DUF3021 domain-containing protein [Exiguobacterium sp. SH3S3]TCI63867.1 DUF3021 domain-containing protein [Exiguobacterium sp. SH3S2]
MLFKTGLIRGSVLLAGFLTLVLWQNLNGNDGAARSFLFYVVIAFFLGLTSVIYQIHDWSFSKQILTHYGAMHVTVLPTALLSGFYPLNSFQDLLDVYIQFNLTGLILFAATFFISKLLRYRKPTKID